MTAKPARFACKDTPAAAARALKSLHHAHSVNVSYKKQPMPIGGMNMSTARKIERPT